jgi:hypothetical protein
MSLFDLTSRDKSNANVYHYLQPVYFKAELCEFKRQLLLNTLHSSFVISITRLHERDNTSPVPRLCNDRLEYSLCVLL